MRQRTKVEGSPGHELVTEVRKFVQVPKFPKPSAAVHLVQHPGHLFIGRRPGAKELGLAAVQAFRSS